MATQKKLASYVREGALSVEGAQSTTLYPVDSLQDFPWNALGHTDGIILMMPTYMGDVARAFKAFMGVPGKFWITQNWADKIAEARAWI